MCSRDNASTAKAFLQATAKGYEYAASHPEEAAQCLCQAVEKDTAEHPLPSPLDPEMVLQSQQMLSKVRSYCGCPKLADHPPYVMLDSVSELHSLAIECI